MLLTNAILHIVSNNATGTRLSQVELDVDSEACFEFVTKHVRRLLRTPAAKEATFRASSPVYEMIGRYQRSELHFKELSWKMCERLAGIMQDNKDIPPADVLVAAFDHAKARHLAIVKFSCGECFTHRVVERDGITETHLVKNIDVLPLTASKVEEACVIPFDPMILRILEKPYPVGGEQVDYFSQLFLDCDAEMSKQEAAEIIQDTATHVTEQFFDGDVEMETKIKTTLIEYAAENEDDSLDLEGAVKAVFGGREEPPAAAFIERVNDAGLPKEVKLDKSYVQSKFRNQHIKAENGIEIKIPLDVAHNPDCVRITQNPDGTFTVMLRNLQHKV